MTIVALSPFLSEDGVSPSGTILTAILPGGCQLGCPYCAINMRNERKAENELTPTSLATLARELDKLGELAACAVVGDEPLQETAWPYLQSFLGAAKSCRVPTSIVTNGVELEAFVHRLIRAGIDRVFVSLDSTGERQDKLRRLNGAFGKIDRGLRLAMQEDYLQDRISIASILMPRGAEDVSNVISYAEELGIKDITVSPLAVFRSGKSVQVHPWVKGHGWKVVPQLQKQAVEQGVNLVFTDEFRKLGGEWSSVLKEHSFLRPASYTQLLRVSPSRQIFDYEEIRQGKSPSIFLPRDLTSISQLARQLVTRQLERRTNAKPSLA